MSVTAGRLLHEPFKRGEAARGGVERANETFHEQRIPPKMFCGDFDERAGQFVLHLCRSVGPLKEAIHEDDDLFAKAG